MRQRLTNVFIPIILLVITCFYWLTTLIEMSLGYSFLISGFMKFFIVIPFILFIVTVTRWVKGSIRNKVLLALTIVLIIFSRSVSDRFFLGQQIAYTYLGQDAGFEELYLYKNGKSRLTYGGIFGVTDNYYGTFNIVDSIVYVDSEARLLDLELYAIKLQDRTFTIKHSK